MDDTWTSRDLPVLDVVVRLLEDNFQVTVAEIATETGIVKEDVARALDAMNGTYVDFETFMTGGVPDTWCVRRVYPAARQAVGQWPTPESLVDRLAEAFRSAADHEPDEAKRTRLREVASVLGQTGREIAVEVAARVILRQTGMG